MKIIIKETSAIGALSIIEPKTGLEYIIDYIANSGALIDGQFEWDEDREAYVCDQATYDWWTAVVADNQALANRIYALEQEHGVDAVWDVIGGVGAVDLGDHAEAVNNALNDAFGTTE